jgi:cytochrome c biogenesis protein CcmG/thiol:disulfide interchange protein DsbE
VVKKFVSMNLAPVYGLNYKDKPDEAKAWLKELGDPYQASLKDVSGDTGIDWGVYGVPETFVMDKKGIVRFKHVGPINEQALLDKIVPLVRELNKEAG